MTNANAATTIEDPPIARALFGDTRWAWIWLIVRVYAGWQWLSTGIEKAQTPAWIGASAGTFLTKWVTGSLAKTAGAHPDVQGWYGAFLSSVVLPHTVFWSYCVTYGEICVGLGLILGMFTGIAAFFGTTMNASYLLAGTVSINPILFALCSVLVLAWKTAGWWGIDRWLLPKLGTPWKNTASQRLIPPAIPTAPAAT
jgi:thiosulfate dehydrogenase [quinone] large subunit